MLLFREFPNFNFDPKKNENSFNEPLPFAECIKFISKSIDFGIRTHEIREVADNFFSKACSELNRWQLRGIERIALGSKPLMLHSDENKRSRFIPSIHNSALYTGKEYDAKMYLEFIGEYSEAIKNIASNEGMFDTLNGIGNPKIGNILIVGDRPGTKAMGLNVPFVGSGSGKWLTQLLDQQNVDERELYWVNSHDGFGKACDKGFVDRMKPSKIICLGTTAFDWAGELGEKYELILLGHPSYWMRFHSKEKYPLLDLLPKF